ncbi:MFS general substrate transporter [Glarea lozoyensis ATCC 20868]|uniref:MFS general substrate transporter n=1 Tax=Glarea lozoyensis (strain ATCC 20868 / MF5171) TaxID=1116229 RepID=S3CYK0_GLAL2|nr:MFS general substrate transporter [Glarea lozoyensis ATCC 20868]EPE30675.1 MFS general substrate transporter [Glarea lozoyensis ATCC 20868]
MFGGSRYFGLRGQKLNLAVGIIAGVDFFLFGYDQGVMGGLLTLGSWVEQFPEIDSVNNPTDTHISTIQGITVASYNVGCFIGAIITIFIGDILGRRKMIFLGSAIMVVGAALQASAFSLPHLIVGRIITGFGNGMNTSTVPTWAAETSKSHKRGKMVMIEGAMITGGIALSYWVDFAFSYLEPNPVSWRFPLALQILFALILLAFIMELPESPRWLLLKGNEHEAISVIAALEDLPQDDHVVQTEFMEIKDTVLEMKSAGWADLFTMGPERNFHRVALGYVNQVFQQISGINLITYYAPTIYNQYIGLPHRISSILAACNGTEYFLASWVAVYTIERFGRRALMLFGAAGMSGSMAILAGMNYMSSVNLGGSAPGIVSAVFLFVFNTFFAVGWLGMTWLYPAEIVPLKIRAPSNGLSTSANWAFNFMVVMITPVSFTSIGYKTYIIFAVINAFIFPVVYFFYPETAYRSLEEIDNIFRKTSRGWRGWFDVVKIARDEPRRYGKHGELLIEYENTDEHRRRSSVAATDKPHSHRVENAHQETTTNSAGSSDYEKRRTDVV